MSEVPPAGPEPPVPPSEEGEHRHETHDLPEPMVFPRWVPVLIGVVLLAMAALAVFTGLRYRTRTFTSIVRPQRTPAPTRASAPPGEPEAGASLVLPGESGDNAPAAHPAVTGRSRAVITNEGGTVNSTVRIWARRGMILDVVPPDTVVYVNELPVGQASQFNSTDEIYDFPAAGSYNVRLSAPGFKDRQFVVTASETAKEEIARISVKLEK
jgi:hypothetical protein